MKNKNIREIRVIAKTFLLKNAVNKGINYLVDILKIKDKTIIKYINYPFLMSETFLNEVINKLNINIEN